MMNPPRLFIVLGSMRGFLFFSKVLHLKYHGAGDRLAPAAHFLRRAKNRLLQRFAYAIRPLRRDTTLASGRRASRAINRPVASGAGRTKGIS
jgi:hypothetical protein